jgi:hypothetical protein
MNLVQQRTNTGATFRAMPVATIGRCVAIYVLKVALITFVAAAVARSSIAAESGTAESPSIRTVHVGFANHVKAGHWAPVRVEIDPLLAPKDVWLEVTAVDNDGVPAVSSAPLRRQSTSGSNFVGIGYTNVGQHGMPIDVSLVKDDEALESRRISPSATPDQSRFVGLSATAELLVFFGPVSPRVLDAHTARNPANGQLIRQAVNAEDVSELPEDWFGYDAVDLAVLTIGNDGPIDKYSAKFADDEKRFGAFIRWIELGGRLVIFCGSQSAVELLGPDRRLARLLPGKLEDIVSLPETGRLEHFAGSEVPITAREPIRVPRLIDVEGKIELHEGPRVSDLPLVVRSPRGFGEVTFVALDPYQPPFADWPGRKAFVDAVVRPYLESEPSVNTTPKLVTRGYTDMSGALRQKLGRTFVGAWPIAFSVVTVLAISYLLVLGPLDYLVTQKWLKAPWTAWMTFPVILALFGGLAFTLAERRHGGGQLRVNQLELVDVDSTTGQARGTIWSAVYSPAADELSLRYDVEALSKETGRAETRMHSWPLPGNGIGGTQSGRRNPAAGDGYRYGDQLDALLGVPILTSGTKSLLARWTARTGPLVLAELRDDNGLVTGSIENRTGRRLRNVRLYHGEWGYRLGTIDDGGRIDVGEELRPRSFKTIIIQDSLTAADRSQSAEQVFFAERASLKETLNVMMFYDALGGFSFAQLQNRFQAYCDFSRMTMLGRPVLIADVDTRGSRLVNAESGEAIGDEDSRAVIYRFVLPLRNTNPGEEP